jgi:hypothetical protein
VSKRHQTSRRKTYGRRQHELRERSDRRAVPELSDGAWDERASGSSSDAFSFLDARAAGSRFALSD